MAEGSWPSAGDAHVLPASAATATLRGAAGQDEEPPRRSIGSANPQDCVFADDEMRLRTIWTQVRRLPVHMSGVGLASCPEDLWDIARLRYALYITRDGKSYEADHEARSFVEPADRLSLHFLVRRCGQVVAALRATRAADAAGDPFMARLLEFAALPRGATERTAVISRLVVENEMAAKVQLVNLFRACHRVGLAEGVANCVIGARPEMTPLFERFGFQLIGRDYLDPIAGPLRPLVIFLADAEHLAAVRSPLLPMGRCQPKPISGDLT